VTLPPGIAPRRRVELSPAVRSTFLVLFVVGGVTNYSLPVYLQHLTSDRHLSLSSASAATGVFYIAGSTVGLFVSRIVNRSDPRRVVAAGAVVTKNVPDFALVAGVPARRTGWVGRAGSRLVEQDDGAWRCPATDERYEEIDGTLTLVTGPVER